MLSATQSVMLVEKLGGLAHEYEQRQAPKRRLREMMMTTEGALGTFQDHYGKRQCLLEQHGLNLEQVTRISAEVHDARLGAKRRRLSIKQSGKGALR